MNRKLIAVILSLLLAPAVLVAHSGSHKKVMGVVSKVADDKVYVTKVDGKEAAVVLTTATTYVQDGAKADRSALKPGLRVVIDLANADGSAEQVKIGKATSQKEN